MEGIRSKFKYMQGSRNYCNTCDDKEDCSSCLHKKYIRKITKNRFSYVTTIPKEILNKLNMLDTKNIEFSIEENKIIITKKGGLTCQD